ncbi:hypothetical protein ACFXTO_047714 [Malus domestica]
MSKPPLKLLVRNRLPGTFLSVTTSYASREDTTSAWRIEEASENDASKHVEASTTNTCADHPLLLQKQKYLISSGSKARVSHIMLFPNLFLCPCSYLQNKEKGSNQSKPEIKRPISKYFKTVDMVLTLYTEAAKHG